MAAHQCVSAILQGGTIFETLSSLPWTYETSCLLPFHCGVWPFRMGFTQGEANSFIQEYILIGRMWQTFFPVSAFSHLEFLVLLACLHCLIHVV